MDHLGLGRRLAHDTAVNHACSSTGICAYLRSHCLFDPCASVVESSPPATAASRRAALAFILVTVTLDMLALGVIVPVLPRLVVDFVGGDAARGAEIYGLFGTV